MEFVSFLLVGRLLVFLLQKFPFQKTLISIFFREGGFLEELLSCSLCLGTWVYAFLGYLLKIDVIFSIFNVYVVGFNEVVTGAIISFIVYIFEIGWNTRFGILEVN